MESNVIVFRDTAFVKIVLFYLQVVDILERTCQQEVSCIHVCVIAIIHWAPGSVYLGDGPFQN